MAEGVHLTLEIDDKRYRVAPIRERQVLRGFALAVIGPVEGRDEPEYSVTRRGGRVACDCPDFEHRRRNYPERGPCKHGRALVIMGLFDRPEDDAA